MGKKKKNISDEVLEKWYKDDWKLLNETKSSKVDKLFELYKRDRYITRVIYMNDTRDYAQYRTVLFTTKEGEFTMVLFRKSYGISKTNVMYNHQKRVVEILYKKGKFYLINNIGRGGKGIKTLTLNSLENACFGVDNISNFTFNNVINLLTHRFPWLEFIVENKVLKNVAFNTIVSKKLFNLKKALTHEYKTTHPVAKMLHARRNSNKNSQGRNLIDVFEGYLPYINNIESLQENWFEGDVGIFHDTLKMAKTLDKRVNASWTPRRLKEEHDKWAKELSDIVFIDGNRNMNINELYLRFAQHSGYEIIRTTKDMAYEGKRQNHCVATYVNNVESGGSAILRTTDYTIEIGSVYMNMSGKSTQGISIKQVRGYGNCNPTEEVANELKNKVRAFNRTIDPKFEFNTPIKKQVLGYDIFTPQEESLPAVPAPAGDGFFDDYELPF